MIGCLLKAINLKTVPFIVMLVISNHIYLLLAHCVLPKFYRQ